MTLTGSGDGRIALPVQDWKYICFALDGGTVILFPPHLSHADVAERFRGKAESAGFVRFDEEHGEMVCYGRSETLKLEPKDGDDFLVNMLLSHD